MNDSGPKHDAQRSPLRQIDPAPTALDKVKMHVSEDGLFLFTQRLLLLLLSAVRSRLIGSRLRARGFRIGRSPKLRGLRHITVGSSFSGGDCLWMEAVLRYGGGAYCPSIVIGDNVTMSDNVHIGATFRIHIANGVLLGSRVTLIDHNHGVYDGYDQSSPLEAPSQRRLSSNKSIEIGENVWIGEGVVVLPGVVIGEGSIIGANSVVIGNIPAYCIAVGSPARPVRIYDFAAGEWAKCKLHS